MALKGHTFCWGDTPNRLLIRAKKIGFPADIYNDENIGMPMNKVMTQQAPGLLLLILPLISSTGLAQENTVYQSHPFNLDIEQARPAPFQLQPVDPTTMNGCCINNYPGWTPNFPFLNQWQGIPYRQDFYILDGSISHSDSKIYRSGSVYTGFQIEGDNAEGNRQMVQDRVIVLPGN